MQDRCALCVWRTVAPAVVSVPPAGHADGEADAEEDESLPASPMSMQDGSTYQLLKASDAPFGGLMSPHGDVPTAWVSYVSVADVDATAKKIKKAGGTLHMDAFDVPGVGRM